MTEGSGSNPTSAIVSAAATREAANVRSRAANATAVRRQVRASWIHVSTSVGSGGGKPSSARGDSKNVYSLSLET